MNTITEAIPTAFAPETAFLLSVRPTDGRETTSNGQAAEAVLNLPLLLDRDKRGIPDSALND